MPWMCGQLQVLRLDFKIGELVRHLAVNVTMPKKHRQGDKLPNSRLQWTGFRLSKPHQINTSPKTPGTAG